MIDNHAIGELLNCQDTPLLDLINKAITTFAAMPSDRSYTLAFSGGKDSHALLGAFLLYKRLFNANTNNFQLIFADTRLETDELYQLVEKIEQTVTEIATCRALPEHSYWYYQFVIGYPVPNYKNRWCTKFLKVKPMNTSNNSVIPITGRHYGESAKRDERLEKCSKGECGSDIMSKVIPETYEPLLHFTNCNIWDFLFYLDGTILYKGVFNNLQNTYQQSESSNSLRMGCFMCPVVGLSTIKGNNNPEGVRFRLILEELRKCRRINSPKTKKAGAIFIEDRRKVWQQLNKDFLFESNYITEIEIKDIDTLIKFDSYPKTYSPEWIAAEHERLAKQTIYDDLPLFNQ
jgi:3'-phosphoadenosine 5'-phosphosulfate sulfotransferase (PAPS reductase)/FAD synthetase